ncbi:hypothetical protein ACPCG0_11425 [Propionibacteriaceae bacterium Y1923]
MRTRLRMALAAVMTLAVAGCSSVDVSGVDASAPPPTTTRATTAATTSAPSSGSLFNASTCQDYLAVEESERTRWLSSVAQENGFTELSVEGLERACAEEPTQTITIMVNRHSMPAALSDMLTCHGASRMNSAIRAALLKEKGWVIDEQKLATTCTTSPDLLFNSVVNEIRLVPVFTNDSTCADYLAADVVTREKALFDWIQQEGYQRGGYDLLSICESDQNVKLSFVVRGYTMKYTVADSQGYTFDVSTEPTVESASVDVADQPPGKAAVRLTTSARFVATNTTENRNLRTHIVRVFPAYPRESPVCQAANYEGFERLRVLEGSTPADAYCYLLQATELERMDLAPNETQEVIAESDSGSYEPFTVLDESKVDEFVDALKNPTFWVAWADPDDQSRGILPDKSGTCMGPGGRMGLERAVGVSAAGETVCGLPPR